LPLDVAKIETERRDGHKWRCKLYRELHRHGERTVPGDEKDITGMHSRRKPFCINSDIDEGTGSAL